jgi:hypothetical protein
MTGSIRSVQKPHAMACNRCVSGGLEAPALIGQGTDGPIANWASEPLGPTLEPTTVELCLELILGRFGVLSRAKPAAQ